MACVSVGASASSALLLDLHIDFENGLAALKPIAALQKNFLNSVAVDESAVSRAQVAQETTRRRDFEQTMMAGKEAIFRKVKVGVFAASDQKRVVLIENKLLPVVRAGQNSKRDTHQRLSLPADFEIVERNFLVSLL